MGDALALDWETRSAVDLREVGLYNYSRHPTTDIWCGAYAFDNEPVALWVPGQPCPPRVYAHIVGGGLVTAWNFPFEIALNNNVAVRYGWPAMKAEQGLCSMALAYAMGLPGALDHAALALGLHTRKDAEGYSLMLRMCRPRSKPGRPLVWWSDPEKLARLYEYCKVDVEVERAVRDRLMPLSQRERKVWLMDYTINQRGVQVDLPSAEAAIKLADAMKVRYDNELAEITNGAATSVTALAPLKEWLSEQGCHQALAGLAKADVSELLARDDLPAAARAALTVRQEAGKASNAKFNVMVRQAGADGRLHNLVQYHGAATGRWAGRAVQVHNLPRNMPKPDVIERVLELVRAGEHDAVDMIFGPPLTVVSSCLRAFFVAPKGKVLVAGDFSNIEGRGQAWFSGEEWKLEAFRKADAKGGPGLYELAYSRMFGVPVETVKNPSEERQIGKTCLAAGTQVVTDRGIMDILDVTAEVRLWDGQEWVAHDGLLPQGVRSTVQVDGVAMTPEHLVLAAVEWLPAQTVAFSEKDLSRALATGSANLPYAVQCSCRPAVLNVFWRNVLAAGNRIKLRFTTYWRAAARDVPPARRNKLVIGEKTFGPMLTLCPMTRTAVAYLTAFPHVSTVATTLKTEATQITAGEESMFLNRGEKIDESFFATLLRLKDGTKRIWNWTASTLTKVMSRGIYGLSATRPTKATEEKSEQCRPGSLSLKPVYDLANAGPRKRFTIKTNSGFLIVHNCELAFGYQGGVGSFHVMGKAYGVTVSDAKADEFKEAWRAAHPRIVRTWYDIQGAAIRAVENPGNVYECGHPGRQAKFRKVGSFLWCLLPSGRAICYPYPKILQGEFGPQLTYMTSPSPDDRKKGRIIHDPQNTANWARVSTYGGSLFNNIVQGMCRDILAETMLKMEEAGLPVVLHVHDEAVAEVDEGLAEEKRLVMQEIMRTPPAWAKGFPVWADCSVMRRYGK